MADCRSPRCDCDRRGLSQPARARHTEEVEPVGVRRALRCANGRRGFGEPPVKLKPQMIAMGGAGVHRVRPRTPVQPAAVFPQVGT